MDANGRYYINKLLTQNNENQGRFWDGTIRELSIEIPQNYQLFCAATLLDEEKVNFEDTWKGSQSCKHLCPNLSTNKSSEDKRITLTQSQSVVSSGSQ